MPFEVFFRIFIISPFSFSRESPNQIKIETSFFTGSVWEINFVGPKVQDGTWQPPILSFPYFYYNPFCMHITGTTWLWSPLCWSSRIVILRIIFRNESTLWDFTLTTKIRKKSDIKAKGWSRKPIAKNYISCRNKTKNPQTNIRCPPLTAS